MLSIFPCACWPYVCLLWKNVYSRLLTIFNWVFAFLMLSCMNCLYILDINPLTVISFANIFSHSVGCLLFCQWFPLLCKRFCLIMSHLFIFAFVSLALGGRSKKILLRFIANSVLPMFSSRGFIVPSYI